MPRQRIVWLFTGSRLWTDQRAVDKFVAANVVPGPQGDLVVHGYAAGLDSAVNHACLMQGVMVAQVPYPKKFPGRSGGPVRNQVMLDIARALGGLGWGLRCVAFHDDPDFEKPSKHSGTGDMVRRMKRYGFKVRWVHHAHK